MFTVTLTSYGQTQISDLVQIDGIILLYEYVSDISSISNISSYTQVLDEDSAGNIKNNICNVLISDSSSSEYQAHTILFYKNNSGTKNILGGYSAEEPFIKKSTSAVNLWFSFDFSAFTNGFALSAIKAGFANASHNEDGLLHLENPNTTSDDNYSVYNKSQVDALLQDKQSTLSAGDGIAISNGTVKTTGIPFGIVDNTSTATVFTVTVPGIYKLEDGVCCLLKNGVITSASGFTLEVNGLGAKPVYSNMAAATRETTIFNVNYTMLFVYDSTRIEGGAWVCYRGYFSDANSIAYQIRGNVHTLPTTAKFYRYRLLFTSADGTHFVPSNTSTSTNATAKRDVVQTPIDPFGEIVYYSTTTAVEANANPGPTYLWTQYAITLGYSFNRAGAALTLTPFSPVYIKCAPQLNGSAIIDADTPYVQALPNTADGKIYIFLGVASAAVTVELLNNHPIYYHDGTGIRIWHGKDSYSKSELDTIIADYVQTSRTINNKPLTSDITLTLDDISDGTNRSIPTVNNSTITIKKNSSDTGDSFTTNAVSGKTINLGLATVATSGSYNDLSDKPTATVINDSTITIKKNSDDTGDSFTTNTATTKTINLGLSTVATSGSYNDLSNKPTIPTVNNAKLTIKKDTNDTGTEFTANASSDVTCNLGLHTVATSGSYNDLSNKPAIPTVNNSTITIKKNSSDTGDSFTTNAASGKTINLGLATVASSGSYNDLSNKPIIPIVPEDVSAFNNDAGYLTSYTETDPTVPSWAKQPSKPTYTASEVGALPSTTVIPTVNNSTITIKKNTNDTGDSFTTNASSAKTINLGLSTVATSGSYNDLSNKPTIPTVNNAKLTIKKNASDTGTEFTANASSDVTCNLNLATVAISGSYNDLSNKPTIPTVNNATLTIQKNGTTVNTFTANASSNVTANITVPTTVAELTDAGNYAQSSSLTSLVATAQYNSTDKTIEFYNASGTKLNTDIDATAFIKDGMVDNVEITGGNLVISFNTDAGKEDIEIPISDIFDAGNYYTKSQVDGLIPTVNNAKLTIKKNASDTGTEFTANASSNVTCNLGLATVATSGSYNDLSNKPTIPTVNNAKLTIKKSSTDAGTEFTANASTDVTCNLGLSAVATSGSYNDLSNKPTIPADTGDLTNNAGYLVSSDLPTNHVTTDTTQEITGTKTIAENKLKIGSTSSNEDIDNFVFKRGQEFIIGTQTSATSLWKGNTIQDSIYEGMCVNYFVPVACTSTAVTLELTLPDGTTTGAIPVRRNAANTVTNTHIGVGSVVQLTLLLNRTVGSTSYEKVWRMNEWYDSNTNTTGYQLRTNSTVMTVTDTARYYKLYFTSADGEHWVPASVNSTNNATTARAVNQRPINPFGRIVYTSASTSYTTGSNLAATTIWDQYAIVLGYSFNVNGGDLTLTTKTPVYVKCAPQTDGSAIIDSTNPIVQDLPTSADGKIYIFLGIAYDATHIELVINHPVYYHDGNGIKLWIGSTIPSKTSDLTNDSGFITSTDMSNYVTINTNQSITGQKTFVTAFGGGTGNDIKIAFVENAQHYITVASSAEYNNDYISPYFHMSFIGNSGDISTYIETKATYTHNQLSDEYDLTDIVSVSELNNTWSLGSSRSMLKSIYTNEINNAFTNSISFASTETIFNKDVSISLAKDTNTYIYGGNELSYDDYRYWWTNYDQEGMSYTSISISMTEDASAGSILEVQINELSSVTPFGKLVVDTTSYSLSIGTTSVTDSLKTLIESGSISPVENYVFLCFDSSAPSNIIGVVICAELTNQGQTASEKLMFFIPSDDLELVSYAYNPSQGIYFIVNSSGSYSFSNDYNFNYRIIARTSIKDYVDNKIESRIDQGITQAEYSTYASQVYVSTSSSGYSYPLVFTNYAAANGSLSANNKSLYTDTANSVYYNPSTNTLTCPNFAGNVTGNLIGNVTGDLTGNVTGDLTGNVTGNATSASSVGITGNSENNSYPLVWTSGVGSSTVSNKQLYTSTSLYNSQLSYNPSSNTVVCKNQMFNKVNYIQSGTTAQETVTFVSTDDDSSHAAYPAIYTRFRSNNSTYGQAQFKISPYNLRLQTLNKLSTDDIASSDWFSVDKTIIDINTNPGGNSSATIGFNILLSDTNKFDIGNSSNKLKTIYSSFFNGTPVIPQGTASWNSSTHTWSVTCSPALTSLSTGSIICVYFGSYNSYSGSTLNVNDLGAKTIYIRNGVTAGTSVNTSWPSGSYVLFRFSGSYWYVLNSNSYPTSTASGTTNIIPSTDDTYDLGSSSYRWNNLYAYYVGDSSTKIQYGYFNYCSISTLRNGSNSNLATLTSAGIIPYTDSTSSSTGFNLGDSTHKWKSLYISGGHSSKYIVVDSSGGEPTIRPDTSNYGYLGTSSADWYRIYGRQIHVGSNHVAIPPIAATSNTTLGSIQFLRVAIPASTTTGIVSAGTALSSSSYTLMLVTASTGYSYLYFRNNTAPSGTWTTLTDMYYYNSGSSTVYTYVLAYKSA